MESLEEAEVVLVQCKNEKKYVKGCGFMSFARYLSNKYKKKLLNQGYMM